jgi:hypothetical protein
MSYAIRRIPPSAVIDIDDDAELAKWANWFGVHEMEVIGAVAAVGPFASAVRDYLTREE